MTADPYLGRTIGNVLLTIRLGQGAMGAVYRGRHQRFNRDVAVKILLTKPSDLKGAHRERFLREGRAAARIRHPNVVQVMDAGQQDGTAYLIMELVEGSSLGELIEAQGTLAPDFVSGIALGLAQGLTAIHALGIIHRDIKPDNILIGADNIPKITDLGLAKLLDDPSLNRLTATGMVVGTPLYVSPEAIRDPQMISTAADIYSLGATLYHGLGGRPPFPGTTAFDVMRGHLEEPLPPLSQLRPDLPVRLVALVEQCLSKNPERRPSAGMVCELLAGRTARRTRKGLAGRGVLLFSLLIITLLALGALGVWEHMVHRPGPPGTQEATGGSGRPDHGGPVRSRISP